MTHPLLGRDLLALADWNDTELFDVLETAAELKLRQQRRKAHPLLANRTLAMIFEKPSTRTRVGFEGALEGVDDVAPLGLCAVGKLQVSVSWTLP